MECLAKDPDERPQSAGEVRARLATCLDVPRWRQADAHTWWREHGDVVRPRAGNGVHGEVTRMLAVDPDRTAKDSRLSDL